jgi:NADH dehydrogenase
MDRAREVVIVGGGFAGVACATRLSSDPALRVTLLDRHDYHQFQPLLYQVATSQLAARDVGYPLADIARHHGRFTVDRADVTAIDPVGRTVLTSTGRTHEADYLVLAAGSQPFYFQTPGAAEHAIPLYSLEDARRLRARILSVFEDAAREAGEVDRGALEFVVVGGGPTGVEVAGALAETIRTAFAGEYPDLVPSAARVTLVDHGHKLLGAFSDRAHGYAAKVLQGDGVVLRMGTGVTEVGPGHVTLSDGTTIRTRCVIWGGGLQAAPIAAASGLPQGRGGRIDVLPDLRVDGFDGVYAIGDIANIPATDGSLHPQLGSVAQQSGAWAARNIRAEVAGKPTAPFEYLDKGIMAMIGRGAAVAEIPVGHHELHGAVAFAAWLGVHAALMSGVRNRIDAFVEWGWDYFGKAGGRQALDRSEDAHIDWGDDADEASPSSTMA